MAEVDLNPAIRERIDVLRNQNVLVDVLESELTTGAIDGIRQGFGRRPRNPTRTFDTSDEDRARIIEWLLQLPLSGEQRVLVFWPQYLAGVGMRFGDFARHYDNLWFPSADDLFVTDDRGSWLLRLDHEEIFALYC